MEVVGEGRVGGVPLRSHLANKQGCREKLHFWGFIGCDEGKGDVPGLWSVLK